MKAEICLDTPPGKAKNVDKYFRAILLKGLQIDNVWISKKEDRIKYIFIGDTNKLMKLNKRRFQFKAILTALKNNKIAKKGLKKLADSPETYEETMRMLEDNTNITFKFL